MHGWVVCIWMIVTASDYWQRPCFYTLLIWRDMSNKKGNYLAGLFRPKAFPVFKSLHLQIIRDLSNSMRKNYNIHTNARYRCEICNHQVLLEKSLARHKMIVHEGLRYSCKQCKYQTTSQISLVQHQRVVHEGIKYHCRQCNSHFTRKGSLVKHQREIHEGIRFSCGQCNYQATRKGSLAEHKKSFHDGVKQCDASLHGSLWKFGWWSSTILWA